MLQKRQNPCCGLLKEAGMSLTPAFLYALTPFLSHRYRVTKFFAEIGRLCDLPLPTSKEELKAQYQDPSDVISTISQLC